MTFRLRTVETSAQGREIVRDAVLEGDTVTVGRLADNALQLPDLSLDPHHAAITMGSDGSITVEALGAIGFAHDGRQVRSALIAPHTGAELRFGSFRVAVSMAEDGAVLLTVVRLPEADEPIDEATGFSLAGKLPGKRVLSWVLGLALLLVFLALPVASPLLRKPAETVRGDAAWSSGKLSLAHHQLESKCEACHVTPFEPVSDATCLSCHKDISDHAPHARLDNARGPGSIGDRLQWQVAHLFGKPGPGACSDCHTEHEGAGRLPPPAQAFCADCHGELKQALSDTRLGNADDFGRLHPQFQPAVPLAMGSKALTRVSLDAKPREASGLTFSHKLHLDSRGGAARMGQRLGRGGGLDCAGCHRPTGDGIRFLPIDMERDCVSCHSLAYDKVGGTFRKLRHGDVNQMIADLSVAQAASRPIGAARQRPGEFADGGSYYAPFSRPAGAVGSAAQALSRGGICGECHTPANTGGRFSVMPVTQVSRYMQHGWFTHAAHKQEKCTTCHAAEASATSADVLLPDLKTCRTCHLGEGAPRGKVASSCAMCHAYHGSPLAPRGLEPRRRE